MNQGYFLVSSLDPLPQQYMQGFCFQDEDLILGNEGYEKYRRARGGGIRPGQDGAYIVIHGSPEETVIGTDFSGYNKLFLYQRAGEWILSNSLLELARFAAANRLPVTIDESHLASFFIEGTFGNQLTSLHTSVKEARLVPSTMEVVITRTADGSQVALRPTSAISRLEQEMGDYGEALREYLRLWVGRMATVLQSDLHVRSELTGGLDSRTVLSLMLAAGRQIGKEAIRRVNFVSNTGAEIDFAIASQIASTFHLRFMDPKDDQRSPLRTDIAEAYRRWKSLCLGVYAPIYFPQTRPTSTAIVFGGAGGGGHRHVYPNIGVDAFLDKRQRYIPFSAHFKKLKQDIMEDLAFLHQGPEASLDPMILHYRHFRERCHGGRTPQYTNLISPISSAVLRKASLLCSPEQVERRQVFADILLNADPELASMPFDKPQKAFDAQHRAELLDASDAIRSACLNGQVFAAEPSPAENGDFTKQEMFRILRDDFLGHYENMRRAGYFPHQYLEKARTTVEDAARNGRLPHSVDGCPVSHVIFAGELSSLSVNSIGRPSLLTALKAAAFWRRSKEKPAQT